MNIDEDYLVKILTFYGEVPEVILENYLEEFRNFARMAQAKKI